MGYLVFSTAILAACVLLARETLSFVRAERLAQRRRSLAESARKAAAQRPGAEPSHGASRADARPDPGAGPARRAILRAKAALRPPSEDGRGTALGRRLRAAGVPLAPVAWVAAVAILALVAGACAAAASGQPALGCAVGLAVPMASGALVQRRARKRRELFDAQIARALPQIAASVRGSLTLERALRVALVHMEDPLREEFSHVLADASYGMPLHEALEAMARRTQSGDIKTLAAATRIRQSTGGSVGSALALISARVNGRLKEERELRVEIASTRMAKWFVAAAMPAIFLLMYATNADFARFYAQEPLGWAVLGAAAILEAVGLALAHAVTSLDRR